MNNIRVSGSDLDNGLEFLKDALTMHFSNIRTAESGIGQDHADMLKDHINHMTKPCPIKSDASQVEAEDCLAPIAVLPRTISRFAPRATCNPAPNWGLFGRLPRELRDFIYEDALSHDCSTYLEACNCTKEDRRSRSGLALLRTCGKIHNEVISMLYESEVFGISLGYEVSREELNKDSEWQDPVFYRQETFGRQTITRLPHNAFHLIQNLQLNFTDEGIVWQNKTTLAIGVTDNLLRHMHEVCANLQDHIQLQRLDINLNFCCKIDDLDYFKILLEPIMRLRGVQHPTINVCGFQITDVVNSIPPAKFHYEPRFGLTDEFNEYLEELLMSPHDTPAPPNDELELFEDDYDHFDGEEYSVWKENDEQLMRRYLRDVYRTEDIEALHGGMPERWHIWLNSEHAEDCDWFNIDDEEAD